MMRWLLLVALAGPAQAETLVAARTIRAQAVLTAQDLVVIRDTVPGMLSDPALAIGQEARITLYAGRPIRPGDLGPPAIVERNQIVPLAYQAGPLSILTEGRALMRGGAGDVIRVMNLASRSTVSGRIGADGTVSVGTAN
ncbi:flagellar basal body P-ring formation chaperone FlgA [Gemmobacter nectariphilus]|uniref:flagellar basal body P-ring formation chaperone FlgA n=1 Tax=Gemmobacter nectariphilus TaxID=220343 RepID=UPI00040E3575|nr:flagellar basal body P-ring formation chaperone FlgA [Gemmobacter nectariphilus]